MHVFKTFNPIIGSGIHSIIKQTQGNVYTYCKIRIWLSFPTLGNHFRPFEAQFKKPRPSRWSSFQSTFLDDPVSECQQQMTAKTDNLTSLPVPISQMAGLQSNNVL